MVVYLFVLIMVIALIAGCLLQQFEKDMMEEAFQTVPGASYWVFGRLISMKDPWRWLSSRLNWSSFEMGQFEDTRSW